MQLFPSMSLSQRLLRVDEMLVLSMFRVEIECPYRSSSESYYQHSLKIVILICQ